MGSFALRRFCRIYPPYWVCVGLTALAVGVIDVLIPMSLSGPGLHYRPWWFSPSQWFGTITLTELWRYHLFGGPYASQLAVSWSLVYEEQFYLVVGLLLVFARSRLFLAALAVAIACPVVAAVCRHYQVPISGFFFDGAWTFFACGGLVYYALNYSSRGGRAAAAVLFAGLVYSWRDPVDLLTHHQRPDLSVPLPSTLCNYDMSLFVATLFSLVLLLARRGDGWVSSCRWLRPLFACGTMCYSLYLVHGPVLGIMHGVSSCVSGPTRPRCRRSSRFRSG